MLCPITCALTLTMTLVVLFAAHSSLKHPGIENNLKLSEVIRLGQKKELRVWRGDPSGKFMHPSQGSSFGCLLSNETKEEWQLLQ